MRLAHLPPASLLFWDASFLSSQASLAHLMQLASCALEAGLVKVPFVPTKDTGNVVDHLRLKLIVNKPQEHQMDNQD